MSQDPRSAWLKLSQLTGLNLSVKQQLIEAFEDPERVFACSQEELNSFFPSIQNRTLLNTLRKPVREDILDQQLALLDAHGITLVSCLHADYPKALKLIKDPPIALYTQGDTGLLNSQQLAIVGSRNASPSGLQNAEQFAYELSDKGLTITSGLAFGIDAKAHTGALRGLGSTVAVVATGLEQVYPRQNQALANKIIESGVIVTEFVPGTPPRREHFPRRNRIISGLSFGTLVVEASTRSGSLITARLAGEQGREVLAIPGSIHNAMSKGCHALIKQGAKLIETTQDILEELAAKQPDIRPSKNIEAAKTPEPELDSISQKVLNLVDFAPTSVEKMTQALKLPVSEITVVLLQLELDGWVAHQSNGQYQRIR